MISSSKNYIEGFVETCYKYGIHEKQAAALLNLAQIREVMADEEMKKEARFRAGWEAAKTLGKGVGLLGKGTGQLVAAPFKGSGGTIKAVGSGVGKAVKGVGRWTQDTAKFQDKLLRTGLVTGLGAGAIGGAGYGAKNLWNDFRSSSRDGLNHIIDNVVGLPGNTSTVGGISTPVPISGAGASSDGPMNEGWGDTLSSPQTPPTVTSGNVSFSDESPLNRERQNVQALKEELARRDASFADSPARRMQWMQGSERAELMNRINAANASYEQAGSTMHANRAAAQAELNRRIAENESRQKMLREGLAAGYGDRQQVDNTGRLERLLTGVKERVGLITPNNKLVTYEDQLRALQQERENILKQRNSLPN